MGVLSGALNFAKPTKAIGTPDDPKREAIREAYKSRRHLFLTSAKQWAFVKSDAEHMKRTILPVGLLRIKAARQDHAAYKRPRLASACPSNVVWQDFATKPPSACGISSNRRALKHLKLFSMANVSKEILLTPFPAWEESERRSAGVHCSIWLCEELFQGVDAGVIKPSKKVYQRLSSPDGRRLYERNYAVMQLLNVAPFKREDMVMTDRTCKNRNDFINLCGELGFASFMQDPDGILNLF